MDRGLLEFFGPHGISTQIYTFSRNINEIRTSFVYHILFLLISFLSFFLLLIGG
jgi:hypothetical protein